MAIVALIYRTTDAGQWGTGIGRDLNPDEIDSNFYTLAQAINDIELAAPNEIVSVDVQGATNDVVITMGDGSTFSFPLPRTSLRFRGNWAAATAYLAGDMFAVDDFLYFVGAPFTSSSVFNPDQGPPGNPYAQKLIPYTTRIRAAFYWPTKPGAGLGTSATMFGFLSDVPYYLSAGLVGAKAELEVAATGALSFPISKNATPIGSVNFAAGATVGTFTFNDTTAFNGTTDKLRVSRTATDPLDATAAGLMLTIPGRLGAPA